MRIFLDTNIILDVREHRQPYAAEGYAVLDRCQTNAFPVYIAWHSVSNAFYIYRKKAGAPKAREALEDLLKVMTVAATGHAEMIRAFTLGFNDLEDALQSVAAEACAADCIVTRNVPHFANSSLPVLAPTRFLNQFPPT